MKTAFPFVALAVLLCVGCLAPGPAAEGHDPFVIEVENDLRTALHVVDGFLAWEFAHPADATADAKALGVQLRAEFPDDFLNAQAALRLYKRTRGPDQLVDLGARLEPVNAALLLAVRSFPPVEVEKAYRSAVRPKKP